jgi:hypothetical protein
MRVWCCYAAGPADVPLHGFADGFRFTALYATPDSTRLRRPLGEDTQRSARRASEQVCAIGPLPRGDLLRFAMLHGVQFGDEFYTLRIRKRLRRPRSAEATPGNGSVAVFLAAKADSGLKPGGRARMDTEMARYPAYAFRRVMKIIGLGSRRCRHS